MNNNNDEKMLPLGESTLRFEPPAAKTPEPKPAPAEPARVTPAAPVSAPAAVFGTTPPPPTKKQQQWGVVISIIIIVLMIVVGAFYSWGKRIAEENALIAPTAVTE